MIRRPAVLTIMAMAVLGCGQQASSDGPPAEPPTIDPGVAVGEAAPDFKLSDQHGKQHSLRELLDSGNVALVFYRSSDW